MNSKPTNKFLQEARRLIILSVAAAVIAFNLKSFVRTGDLIPGGFSGIAILIQHVLNRYLGIQVAFSFLYLPLNLIPAYIGFRFIGKKFTLYSFYVVALSSVLTDIFPVFTITYDTLLISIFGGLVSASAISLCLMQGASGGGTDFISIYLAEKKGIDAWNYIFIANACILVIAGLLFGFDKALYSIIYQFTSTQVLGALYKNYQQDTLLIVTDQPSAVYGRIRELTHHDATLIHGIGCFEGSDKSILYSVIGRAQVGKVITAIKLIDSKAFINVIKTEQVNGRFYRPPTL